MAGRREKLRRVGIIPEYRGFTPDGLASGDAIEMTVDELEVLRLCDLEGLNQEAVAQQMGIARATVAAICSRAHRKVANALVNGRALVIEGGNIAYSPITATTAAWPAKEVDTMRVATTYDNGNIFMHFGRSELTDTSSSSTSDAKSEATSDADSSKKSDSSSSKDSSSKKSSKKSN